MARQHSQHRAGSFNPLISVITPTCDRPEGIALLQQYMARQTVQPDQWIIANGGDAFNLDGATVINDKRQPGPENLAKNILNGLECATGDVILIMEDDDWYAPDHIEMQLKHLASCDATGDNTLRYFNLRAQAYRIMKNVGSALCQTAFKASLKPKMVEAAFDALTNKSYNIDGAFWSSVPRTVHNDHTVVGIKGLSGTVGLGIGHRPDARWKRDPTKLREWIGQDAGNYKEYERQA